MIGMNLNDGRATDGQAHLRQSIRDILTTPLGTRVMRREYGSRLFELVDAPLNADTLTDIYAATAEALDRWEPRFALRQVNARRVEAGGVAIYLEGDYLPDGLPITLDGIVV